MKVNITGVKMISRRLGCFLFKRFLVGGDSDLLLVSNQCQMQRLSSVFANDIIFSFKLKHCFVQGPKRLLDSILEAQEVNTREIDA